MKPFYPGIRIVLCSISLLFYGLFAHAQTTPVNGTTTFNTIGNGAYIEYARTSNGSAGFTASNVQNSGWNVSGYTSGPNSYVIAGENWGGGSTGGFVYLGLESGGTTIISMRFRANDGKMFDLNTIDLGYDVGGANTNFTITGYRAGIAVPGASFSVPSFASFGNGGDWRRGINIAANTNFIGIDEFRITPNTPGLLTALDVDNINATNFRVGSTLPLHWLQFTATMQETAVILEWRTANEQGTKDFVVQHYIDGRGWQNIGTVMAAGNYSSEQVYSFQHNSPATGLNAYRLLQRDADGRGSYSRVVTVNVKTADEGFSVYPNPATGGKVQIKLKGPAVVSVYNSIGIFMLKKQLPAGVSILDLSSLTKGVYTLTVKDRDQVLLLQ
jgi:hypothetical protein